MPADASFRHKVVSGPRTSCRGRCLTSGGVLASKGLLSGGYFHQSLLYAATGSLLRVSKDPGEVFLLRFPGPQCAAKSTVGPRCVGGASEVFRCAFGLRVCASTRDTSSMQDDASLKATDAWQERFVPARGDAYPAVRDAGRQVLCSRWSSSCCKSTS